MMTLVGLAISVAYLYSAAVVFGLRGTVFFWETATLIDIMLLGHWIEMRSVMGASRALEELVRLLPAEAHRLRSDGSTEDVPVTNLRQGDVVLVKPSERIPADGEITEGRTSVNQALLTGESQPVEKGPRDAVLGGSVNGEAAITLRITRTLLHGLRLARQQGLIDARPAFGDFAVRGDSLAGFNQHHVALAEVSYGDVLG